MLHHLRGGPYLLGDDDSDLVDQLQHQRVLVGMIHIPLKAPKGSAAQRTLPTKCVKRTKVTGQFGGTRPGVLIETAHVIRAKVAAGFGQ